MVLIGIHAVLWSALLQKLVAYLVFFVIVHKRINVSLWFPSHEKPRRVKFCEFTSCISKSLSEAAIGLKVHFFTIVGSLLSS